MFMIAIPTATIFPNYAGIFFITDAHGQENSTAVLKDIQTLLSKQTSSQQKIATSPNKMATQGAYITLSVFFLGISLVLFGLRMTMKAGQEFGKYFDLMILALTVPVLVLVALYQIGITTHYRIILYATDEPYLVISFLLYIPIGIILFLLVSHKRMKLPQLCIGTHSLLQHRQINYQSLSQNSIEF
jgi:hypothetical protein